MGDASVRVVRDDELAVATRLVGRQMLGSITQEVAEQWAALFRGQENVVHGAYLGDELVGCAAWFPTDLATPGTPLPAAGVTGVAVLSNHRRQGHLSRLMQAELEHVVDAGRPVAVLIAAEYPIYGRFGYGWATRSCGIHLDLGAARFRDDPTGTITLADPEDLQAPLQASYEARWARTPGAITRVDEYWERESGQQGYPGRPFDPGRQRGAVWHDDEGRLQGCVRYSVQEGWTGNRPDGTAEVEHLYGATPEAERELWRHLTTVDWCRTAKAGSRAVDDPLPWFLEDARAATSVDHSDNVWLRVLDVPAAFGARTSPVAGSAVVEVHDPMGFAAGRWLLELGPDGGAATATDATADVALSASALGSAFLGGHTLQQLAQAGLVDDHGGLGRASALLQTPTAPWSPLDF